MVSNLLWTWWKTIRINQRAVQISPHTCHNILLADIMYLFIQHNWNNIITMIRENSCNFPISNPNKILIFKNRLCPPCVHHLFYKNIDESAADCFMPLTWSVFVKGRVQEFFFKDYIKHYLLVFNAHGFRSGFVKNCGNSGPKF